MTEWVWRLEGNEPLDKAVIRQVAQVGRSWVSQEGPGQPKYRVCSSSQAEEFYSESMILDQICNSKDHSANRVENTLEGLRRRLGDHRSSGKRFWFLCD